MLRVVTDDEGRAEMRSTLDEIVLASAQRMLAAALEAEVDAYAETSLRRAPTTRTDAEPMLVGPVSAGLPRLCRGL